MSESELILSLKTNRNKMDDTPRTDALRKLIALLGKHRECTHSAFSALLVASDRIEEMERELNQLKQHHTDEQPSR